MDFSPIQFIDEPIEVEFDLVPLLEKKPIAPDRFWWSGNEFTIIRVISEWNDFSRKGRMSRNMSPVHADHARLRGSWGVGRFTFRVLTSENRIFDIYYDRSPKDSTDRKGHWFILGERNPE
jgi:hypothetical protein